MEKVIKSIFCCSTEDSNSNDYPTSKNKASLNQSRTHQKLSAQHSNNPQQQRSNQSAGNAKNKSNTNKNSNNNNNNKNNNRYMREGNQRTSEHNHNSQTSSNNIIQNKTDVNVYEATDSTLESNEDGQHSDATNMNNNQNVPSSVMVDNDKFDRDSSEVELNEDATMDDFFDLSKIQQGQSHASNGWLLEDVEPKFKNKKCLVLDLDETLVHSSFKFLRHADFVIPVDIDNQVHNVYVIKRPGVDEFMRRVGELYEVVVFTASVSRYGDPLLDELDINHSVHHRLFRDSCYNYQNNYIKNLSQLGRPLSDIIILDNSPASYIFHPQHAIPISSWFSDAHDNELLDIIPFLEDLARENVDDVGLVLDINL